MSTTISVNLAEKQQAMKERSAKRRQQAHRKGWERAFPELAAKRKRPKYKRKPGPRRKYLNKRTRKRLRMRERRKCLRAAKREQIRLEKLKRQEERKQKREKRAQEILAERARKQQEKLTAEAGRNAKRQQQLQQVYADAYAKGFQDGRRFERETNPQRTQAVPNNSIGNNIPA